jgi:uncharacterized protein
MAQASRDFQVFAKPAGPLCNLACQYCYYLKKEGLFGKEASMRMPDRILEEYIIQHIQAWPTSEIRFSWHGGEPTILGLDYFRKIVSLQRKHQPAGKRIINGLQTNGTLLNEDWCRFLAEEGFGVGLSLDGPERMHDRYRLNKGQGPTHSQAMRGVRLLQKHRVPYDILCVVHAGNVGHPLEVYQFFKNIGAAFLGFLPLVERLPDGTISGRTVPPEAFGAFLCAVFDEWLSHDIGRVKVQIFEETIARGLGREQGLCIFRPTCGDIPVIEHNGDVFSCDHFVEAEYRLGNILETELVDLLEGPRLRAFGGAKKERLPRCCRECAVLRLCNGGCPKDRLLRSPEGEEGLNFLCAGYKRFFTHCQPFIAQVAAVKQEKAPEEPVKPFSGGAARDGEKTGRNDSCPCGSGKKYKKCCLGKESFRA